jgi:hypothetical protein
VALLRELKREATPLVVSFDLTNHYTTAASISCACREVVALLRELNREVTLPVVSLASTL